MSIFHRNVVAFTGEVSNGITLGMVQKEKQEDQPNSAKAFFKKLDNARSAIKQEWRDASALTLNYLIPPEGYTESTPLETPHQNLGSRAVKSLGSKMVITLLPPSSPFFKLLVDTASAKELDNSNPGSTEDITKRLLQTTQVIQDAIDESNARSALFNIMLYLIVAGNCLISIDKEGENKVINPLDYVVERDGAGNAIMWIVREVVNPASIDNPEVRAFVEANGEQAKQVNSRTNNIINQFELYTAVELQPNGKYRIFQETGGHIIPGTDMEVPKDQCPFLPPLTWNLIEGNNYGIGQVQDTLGDWRNFEAMSMLMSKGQAALAKLLWLVDPNGTTDPTDIDKAESGAVVYGRDTEVTALTAANKAIDFQYVSAEMDKLERRLGQAFLLTSSIQRDGERVTAREITQLAQDLNETQGGTFTHQARQYQQPFLARWLFILKKDRKVNTEILDDDVVKSKIITGLEALGRGAELEKLVQALELLSQTIPGFEEWLNKPGSIAQIFDKLQVDKTNLILSEAEVNAERERQRELMIAKEATKPAVQAIGKAATETQ